MMSLSVCLSVCVCVSLPPPSLSLSHHFIVLLPAYNAKKKSCPRDLSNLFLTTMYYENQNQYQLNVWVKELKEAASRFVGDVFQTIWNLAMSADIHF